MADEQEQLQEADEPPEPPKKKSKLKLIILVVLPLVLILGAGGAVYLFGDTLLKGYLPGIFGGNKAEVKKKEVAVGPILTLEPFIFNLSGNTARFAKVSVAVGVKDPKVLEEAKKMVPVLRDRALVVLSGKTADVLIDVASRDTIKKELYEGLKGFFKTGDELQSVYITDIIIP
jgi:flagellar protein FliL